MEPGSAIEAPLLTSVLEGRAGPATAASFSPAHRGSGFASTSSGCLQVPVGCPLVEVGLKSEPIPRGCVT